MLQACQLELSRFDPDSELSHLNADPGAVAAQLAADGRRGGRRDPRGRAQRRARRSHPDRRARGRGLRRVAPERQRRPRCGTRCARAAPAASRGSVARRAVAHGLSVTGREVRRPPGVRLDLGGTAKGFAADRAAALAGGPGQLRGRRRRRHRPRRSEPVTPRTVDRRASARRAARRSSSTWPPAPSPPAASARGSGGPARASRTTCSTRPPAGRRGPA